MSVWIQEHAADLIGHGLTLIGVVVGVAVVVWQIGRQHRSALAVQQQNAREALKLRIYEQLLEHIQHASDAVGAAKMYVFIVPFELRWSFEQRTKGSATPPLSQRCMEFSRLHNAASSALIRLGETFEAWTIAFPGMIVFQTALVSALHDARATFTPLSRVLLRVLPVDLDDGTTREPPIANLEAGHLEEIDRLVDAYCEVLGDIGGYIFDLRVEAQNNLLGELFTDRVPAREPADPSVRVLSTEPGKLQALMDYFERESDWGKANAKAISKVRESKQP